MTTSIRPSQVSNTSQPLAAAPSFSQRVVAFWRQMAGANTTAVTSRHHVSSRALRASTPNSRSVLTAIQANPPATVGEVITIEPITDEALPPRTARQVLEQWVDDAPPHERAPRARFIHWLLLSNPSFQEGDSIHFYEDVTIHTLYGLTSLPNNLVFHGSFAVIDCPDLSCLPNNFCVDGDLLLTGSNLERLPDNLSVGRDLDLTYCTNLNSLPNDLSVGGDLTLFGCTNFSTLPDMIFNMGRGTDGRIRCIDVRGIDLSADTLNRIRYSRHPGIAFMFRDYGIEFMIPSRNIPTAPAAPAAPEVPVITWNGLPEAQNLAIDPTTTCGITLQTLDTLQQPVYVPSIDSPQQDIPGHVFEFQALLEWHNLHPTHPTNPMTRAPLNLNQLQKITPDIVAKLANRTAD